MVVMEQPMIMKSKVNLEIINRGTNAQWSAIPNSWPKPQKSKVTERDKASSFLQQMAIKSHNPRSFCRYMKYLAVGTRSKLLVIAPRERSRHLTYFRALDKNCHKKAIFSEKIRNKMEDVPEGT
ncbi:unnamed protein product [Ceratitis capitata]|uniref:(Mediterranean fruit fly) hypothetical protein n=1 Tax=Ceratitis capitata TaxID=7213 RepID=A0A811UGD3_CERCA|nr:unnamed protein product [Ceratitis capitata]